MNEALWKKDLNKLSFSYNQMLYNATVFLTLFLIAYLFKDKKVHKNMTFVMS